ncbi:MAG: ABC transporter permease, partial [Ruminococcus sp.]|nr:ABC transporter permease [Ruminococcus sp.]
MKFINLLKKELSELINKQMLISLVFVLSIFLIMGNVMQSATNEIVNDAKNPQINLCNMDASDITKEMLEYFNSNGSKVNFVDADENDLAAPFKNQKKLKSYVVIPKGFGETLENGKKPEILSINKVQSVSTFSGMTGGTEGTISLINGFVALKLAEQQGVSEKELGIIEAPLTVTEHTVVADKSAKISSSSIMTKLLTQNMILPLIVMMLIMLTSQSLIASISNE